MTQSHELTEAELDAFECNLKYVPLSFDDLKRVFALARKGRAAEWRDISTAPRDGTPVLFYAGGGMFIAPSKGAFALSLSERKRLVKAGFWPDHKTWNPTHWLPLPNPPTEERKEDGNSMGLSRNANRPHNRDHRGLHSDAASAAETELVAPTPPSTEWPDCAKCNGTGEITVQSSCPVCSGSGEDPTGHGVPARCPSCNGTGKTTPVGSPPSTDMAGLVERLRYAENNWNLDDPDERAIFQDAADAIERLEEVKATAYRLQDERDEAYKTIAALRADLRARDQTIRGWEQRDIEAQGEIAALRAEIEREHELNRPLVSDNVRLRAENERIRELLAFALGYIETIAGTDETGLTRQVRRNEWLDKARAALEKKDG